MAKRTNTVSFEIENRDYDMLIYGTPAGKDNFPEASSTDYGIACCSDEMEKLGKVAGFKVTQRVGRRTKWRLVPTTEGNGVSFTEGEYGQCDITIEGGGFQYSAPDTWFPPKLLRHVLKQGGYWKFELVKVLNEGEAVDTDEE